MVPVFFQFLNSIRANIPEIYPEGYDNFVLYLEQYYFNPENRFSYKNWDYWSNILEYSDPDLTNNTSESINAKFNLTCHSNFESYHDMCGVIFNFKKKYYETSLDILGHNKLRKRAPHLVRKNAIRCDFVSQYDDFNLDQKKRYLIKYMSLLQFVPNTVIQGPWERLETYINDPNLEIEI